MPLCHEPVRSGGFFHHAVAFSRPVALRAPPPHRGRTGGFDDLPRPFLPFDGYAGPGLNRYQMASTSPNWIILWSAVTTGMPNTREVATMIWSAGSR